MILSLAVKVKIFLLCSVIEIELVASPADPDGPIILGAVSSPTSVIVVVRV